MHPRLEAKILHSSENATVGRYTYGTPTFIRFPSSPPAEIGSFCSIADNVTFILGGNHFADRITTYPLQLLYDDPSLPWHEYSNGPISIGSDVWIGYGSTILSGSTIGHGCIIGAGSVVRGSIPPYHIAFGNPCSIHRPRFPQHIMDSLLADPWWLKSDQEIKSLSPYLLSPP